jgi:hypothetical protein
LIRPQDERLNHIASLAILRVQDCNADDGSPINQRVTIVENESASHVSFPLFMSDTECHKGAECKPE